MMRIVNVAMAICSICVMLPQTTAADGAGDTLPLSDSATQKPNILFCLADDWGWPHAGAYGDKVVKTPTFDRIAQDGVLFEHAFISSPSCTPSRNALVTGQQFYRLGWGANLHSTLDVKHPNFMFRLRGAGYQIGHWRKAWGPGDHELGGYTEHPCGPGSSFKAFMTKRDTSKPFCFWFGSSDPHRGYVKGSGRKSGIPVEKIHVPAFYPDNDEIRSDIADYYVEVQRWDSDVGAAIKRLEEAGELDNTIIVMTGDHGFPFPRGKGNLYDWGSRVPLAIRWGEKVKPGRRVTDFVSFTDIAPTFLDAAGVDTPKEMTGKSLLEILTSDKEGRVDRKRDAVVFGRERHTPAQKKPSIDGFPSRAIRADKWLLILNLEPDRWPAGVETGATHRMNTYSDCDDGPTKRIIMAEKDTTFNAWCFGKRGDIELFDTEKDPDQVTNLAGKPEYAETVKALRQRLITYLEKTNDPRFTDQPVIFDEYPYLGPSGKDRSKKHRN
ncbi:MAG: N-sulfoglucosamine sulfohydrolase [Kiritimatiellia bacterium]|jgi:N-sulfoglucosamine sulfohydrolase